jgi:hypothetical protein
MKRAAAADQPIADDTPLRLAHAAELAFPGGGMTASGLRSEAAKGRLVVERIAGKDYTTLAAIADMRRLCVVKVPTPATRATSPQQPRLLDAQADSALIRLRMLLYERDEKAKLKASPMTKRERDALKAFFESKGTFIETAAYWRRTIRWLDLHGFVEVRFEQRDLVSRITPAGEAEWLRISPTV